MEPNGDLLHWKVIGRSRLVKAGSFLRTPLIDPTRAHSRQSLRKEGQRRTDRGSWKLPRLIPGATGVLDMGLL